MEFKWTTENCIKLIDSYKQYPCLWKCADTKYKCREAKNDAWSAICASIGCENKEDAKRKMRNLVAQFCRERRKYLRMKTCGAASHFVSKWFAYNSLLFLRDKNKVRPCKEGGLAGNTEDLNDLSSGSDIDDTSSENVLHESDVESENFLAKSSQQNCEDHEKEVEPTFDKESQEAATSAEQITETACAIQQLFQAPKSTRIKKAPKRKPDSGDSRVGEAYNAMKEMYNNKRVRDSYAVFGEHVACKIRNLRTECAQNTVEHLISNILFEASMGKFDNQVMQPQLYVHNSQFLEMQYGPSTSPSGSSYAST